MQENVHKYLSKLHFLCFEELKQEACGLQLASVTKCTVVTKPLKEIECLERVDYV